MNPTGVHPGVAQNVKVVFEVLACLSKGWVLKQRLELFQNIVSL